MHLCYLPFFTSQNVNVIGLKNAVHIGLVRRARTQPLDGRGLVAEGFEESERELCRVLRLLGERGYGLFNLDSVHASPHFP